MIYKQFRSSNQSNLFLKINLFTKCKQPNQSKTKTLKSVVKPKKKINHLPKSTSSKIMVSMVETFSNLKVMGFVPFYHASWSQRKKCSLSKVSQKPKLKRSLRQLAKLNLYVSKVDLLLLKEESKSKRYPQAPLLSICFYKVA